MDSVSIPNALLLSLLGISIVFLALILLMICIKALSAAVSAMSKQPAPAMAAPAAPVAITPVVSAVKRIPAPGSIGEMNLYGVDDKTAALLMAIVADELKTPLNELRFLSIREI